MDKLMKATDKLIVIEEAMRENRDVQKLASWALPRVQEVLSLIVSARAAARLTRAARVARAAARATYRRWRGLVPLRARRAMARRVYRQVVGDFALGGEND